MNYYTSNTTSLSFVVSGVFLYFVMSCIIHVYILYPHSSHTGHDCVKWLIYYFTVAWLLLAFLFYCTKEYISREHRGYSHHEVHVTHPTWNSPCCVHLSYVNHQPVTCLLTSQCIRLNRRFKNGDIICLSLCLSTLPLKAYCPSKFSFVAVLCPVAMYSNECFLQTENTNSVPLYTIMYW